MSPDRTLLKGKRANRSRRAPEPSVDLTRLIEIVSAFPAKKICVVGDLVLDEFVSGEISRVSREAPVLILRHRRSEVYPGGGANAAHNLVDLGAHAIPIGVIGDDEGGERLLEVFRSKRVDTSGIFRVKGRATTTKTRYLAGWTHTTEQQVLRVDREPGPTLPENIQRAIERKARHAAAQADAVLFSDYGFGAAPPELARKLRTKLLTLDSRYRLLDFGDAGITAATPNESELEAAYHTQVGADIAKLDELGRRALREMGLQALAVTRGKDGLSLFEPPAKNARHIPIHGSGTPVDVTGAGDTVIAVFTLALAAGASFLEAAHLANYAGGIVVMKPRTATVKRTELEAVLKQEATAQC